MEVKSVEGYLGYELMSKMLESALGEGEAFDIIMESLLSSGAADKLVEELMSTIGDSNKLVKEGAVQGTESSFFLEDLAKAKAVNHSISNGSATSGIHERDRINNAVMKYSKEYGVDEKLIHSIIKHESNYNASAVSSAGAMGLMQLMPATAKDRGVRNPYDIEENIAGGVKHLREYLSRYNNNIELALMAYNAGPGTVSRRGVESLEDLYKMPKETQNYVKKVMNSYRS
ncbi:lytic transglycosylase domain-containing protein [Alloiococcus sp. CFN-8]|uniref:lytic transglycosylase domain-containing protein n=1 Tax=Alloiococcus sp. CFN-8 TaxID=3416081 RepID=UPI003CE7212A